MIFRITNMPTESAQLYLFVDFCDISNMDSLAYSEEQKNYHYNLVIFL